MPKNTDRSFDLVTLGETMIRHFTRDHHRFEQCADLGFSIAGSESNLAVAASRLGLRCGWVSKLPSNPLGQKVEREIAVHGVDTSRVVWTDRGRVGVFYIEFGSKPRPTQVLYDRERSAASTLKPDEIDWGYVRDSKWFHTTGITCALSKTCLATVRTGIEEARRGRVRVSFDLNYRAKLWSPARCKKVLAPLLPSLDLLIASSDDVAGVLGIEGDYEEQARGVREEYGPKATLISAPDGALCLDEKGKVQRISFKKFPIKEVDRIGAGDAFAAGFFAGTIEKDEPTGLLYGAATCALKFSIPGDLALVSREEMLEVARGGSGGVKR